MFYSIRSFEKLVNHKNADCRKSFCEQSACCCGNWRQAVCTVRVVRSKDCGSGDGGDNRGLSTVEIKRADADVDTEQR